MWEITSIVDAFGRLCASQEEGINPTKMGDPNAMWHLRASLSTRLTVESP